MAKISLIVIALCLLVGTMIGFSEPPRTQKMIRVVYPVRFIPQGTIITADMLKYESISEEVAQCAYTDIKGLVGGTARYSMSPDTSVRHCHVYDNDDICVSDELRYVYIKNAVDARR